MFLIAKGKNAQFARATRVRVSGPPVLSLDLAPSSIAEDASPGDSIGTLSASGGVGPYTYAIDTDADAKFAIGGAGSDELVIRTGASLDYETATSHSVTIQITDTGDSNATYFKTLTITVTNVVEPPIVDVPLADLIDTVGNGPWVIDYSGAYSNFTSVSLFDIPAGSGITINTMAQTITVPDAAFVGTVTVQIDNAEATVFDSFDVDVSVANTAPSIVATALAVTVPEGTSGLSSGIEIAYLAPQTYHGSTGPHTTTFDLTATLSGDFAAIAADDRVFLMITQGAGTDNAFSATGYTQLSDQYANDSNDINMAVFHKLMGSTPDTSASVGFTANTGQGATIHCVIIRGLNSAAPFDDTNTTGGFALVAGTNSGIVDPDSVTPANTGAKVLVFGGAAYGSGSDFKLSVPSGMTELSNAFDTTSVRSSTGFVAIADWTSGAYDPAACTVAVGSDNTANSWAANTVILNPA